MAVTTLPQNLPEPAGLAGRLAETGPREDHRTLIVAALAILAVKLIWFAADPTPLFYLGDSKAYISSAMGSVLTDRSNTYGLLIRAFALVPRSLTSLVLVQTLAGAATAWLLALILIRYFAVRPSIAVMAGLVLAAEPLQLLYERMVLTESFALLGLAIYTLLALRYLERPRLVLLPAIAAAGVLALSLRLVYVPVTLLNAVLIPVLGWIRPGAERWTPHGGKQLLTHLAVSLLSVLLLHQAYKVAIGRATGFPPAYQYASGFFMASNWAPLIEPEDATDPRVRAVVEKLLTASPDQLRDVDLRSHQLWGDGGLTNELLRAFDGDRYAANRAAGAMAMRTARRAPLAVLGAAARNFTSIWTSPMERRLLGEQGSRKALDSSLVRTLKERFRLDAASTPTTMTPSKRYHLIGAPWYFMLTLSPLIMLVAGVAAGPGFPRGMILLLVTATVLLTIPHLVSVDAGIRTLHPLAFGTVAAFAVIANGLVRPRGEAKHPSPAGPIQPSPPPAVTLAEP